MDWYKDVECRVCVQDRAWWRAGAGCGTPPAGGWRTSSGAAGELSLVQPSHLTSDWWTLWTGRAPPTWWRRARGCWARRLWTRGTASWRAWRHVAARAAGATASPDTPSPCCGAGQTSRSGKVERSMIRADMWAVFDGVQYEYSENITKQHLHV